MSKLGKNNEKLLQAVAVLQWGHNLLLINKKLSDDEVYFYATESVSKNWNRDLLLNAIKMNTFLTEKLFPNMHLSNVIFHCIQRAHM